jgi:flagellar biosynthesis anti-sigma factor FlgM
MRLTPISNKIATELQKVENAKKGQKPSAKAKSTIAKPNSTSFTSDARRLSESKANVDIAAAKIASEPEIRVDKVEEVKKKISDGYYNSAEFTDKLAEKMATLFGASK